jgi:hypothetical protein
MPVHGKGTGVAIADYDITRWIDQVSTADAIDVHESSCFDAPGHAKEYVQGMWMASATWSGRFGSEIAPLKNVNAVFEAILAAEIDVPFTIAPGYGFNPGSVCYMGPALATKLSTSSPITNVIAVSGSIDADGGFRYGVVLSSKADLTATPTLASVDNGVATATGGAGHLHVDSRSTLNGTLTAVIQHSPDNATWVDLIDFTVVAAATGVGQRIALADGTTIARYVRATITLAGTTGSATVRVALSRRK